MEELKSRIIDAAIDLFGRKGLKFTMDDIAKQLSMSKKTIYTVFRDKEALFYEMVDYSFDKIKEAERRILMDPTLSTLEKLRRVMGALPEAYKEIDLSQVYLLKERSPKTYAMVEERLESGWESTIQLVNQGMAEGVLRPVKISIVKTMFEATIEKFFQQDVLVKEHISYTEALEDVVDILIDGIKA